MTVKNSDGDGVQVFGDNPIFRNILGVKTTYSDWVGGEDGWTVTEREFRVPQWMQLLGCPKEVKESYVYGTDIHGEGGYGIPDSRWEKYPNKKAFQKVMLFRFLIRTIPFLIILAGLLLAKTPKISGGSSAEEKVDSPPPSNPANDKSSSYQPLPVKDPSRRQSNKKEVPKLQH